jgi:hypothetical protein
VLTLQQRKHLSKRQYGCGVYQMCGDNVNVARLHTTSICIPSISFIFVARRRRDTGVQLSVAMPAAFQQQSPELPTSKHAVNVSKKTARIFSAPALTPKAMSAAPIIFGWLGLVEDLPDG